MAVVLFVGHAAETCLLKLNIPIVHPNILLMSPHGRSRHSLWNGLWFWACRDGSKYVPVGDEKQEIGYLLAAGFSAEESMPIHWRGHFSGRR